MQRTGSSPRSAQAPLFKYMQRQHADRLLREGVLRIGTLFEYRNIESHGNHIGDAHEGSKGAVLEVDHLVARSKADLPEFVRDRMSVGPGTVVFKNSTFLVTEDSPNFFIFSCSAEYDPAAMRSMGYDACVKITDPDTFFRAVCHSMRHRGEYQGRFSCVYMERFLHPDKQHGIHPALIKGPVYAQQREYRAIWRPFSNNPQPVIITCRKAARYCKNVA